MFQFPTAEKVNTYYLTGQILTEDGLDCTKHVICVRDFGSKPKRGSVFTANETYYVVTSLNPPDANWNLEKQKLKAINVVDTGKQKADVLKEWLEPFISEVKMLSK